VTWLRRYEGFLRASAPAGDSTAKVTMFLTDLARQDVSASTQNQALQALLMFYRDVMGQELGRVDAMRAKRRERIRYAPTRDEVRKLLAVVQDVGGYPTRLIVHLLYGCGMRVGEPLDLRIKDVDLDNSRIVMHDGKGKDRVVPIPCSLADGLRRQMAIATAAWEADAAAGIPVPLPHQLARKYPRNAFARGWYWVFPAHSTCRHPRTGETVRYRVLEVNVQRCVRAAADRCGLGGMVTPHCLRHAYATHTMRAGACVRDVQIVMGHKSLETTQGYLHAEAGRVCSPVDDLFVAGVGR
jgi:site-specific recombinase XerD